MSIRVGDTIIAGGGIPINKSALYLFDFKWSDHLVNQQQWLRADTFTWHNGSVYSEAYQHLVADIQNKTLQSETISGVTVQFYRADDDHKICPASEEANVAQIYINTGVAWYYILDTNNQQFKLPRTEYNVVGVRSSAGDYVEAGLPNITGKYSITAQRQNESSADGALYASSDKQTVYNGGNNSRQGPLYFQFDASLSSSIYGNSTTVQPPATQMYLYFFIGDFTQTAIEQTAGLNAELFNGKADTNLLNTASNVDFVIDFQRPTPENDYTWYRKYKSGWIEQGGETTIDASTQTVNLPIEMSNTSYAVLITMQYDSTNALYSRNVGTRTTTSFTAQCNNTRRFIWQVKGIAA